MAVIGRVTASPLSDIQTRTAFVRPYRDPKACVIIMIQCGCKSQILSYVKKCGIIQDILFIQSQSAAEVISVNALTTPCSVVSCHGEYTGGQV